MKILLFLFIVQLSFTAYAATQQQMLNESRAAVKTLGGQLKKELQQGMKEGGPVSSIQLCKKIAAQIADDVSDQYGWKIGRTSLQPRNPDNAPDTWEIQVLEAFEKRRDQGENINNMEFFEVIQSSEKSQFRYMKAIPVGGICLGCHGEKIDPAVTEKLDALYPEDQARGYKPGDIRGAFTLIRPAN